MTFHFSYIFMIVLNLNKSVALYFTVLFPMACTYYVIFITG